jgi:hypothetical protein
MWFVCAVAVGGGRQWLISRRAAANAPPATVEEALAQGNPYTWAVTAYLGDRDGYLRRVAEQTETQLEQMWPKDALAVDPPVVTDLGPVFLTTVPYRGTMAFPRVGPAAVRGESRSYAYARGLVFVNMMCATASPGCGDFAGVIRHVERVVLDKPDALDLDSVLPAGQCERVPKTIAGVAAEVVSCVYATRVSATARLLTAAEARRHVTAVVNR